MEGCIFLFSKNTASTIAVLCLTFCHPAKSEQLSDRQLKKEAQTYFSEGEALFESARYAEAAAAFTRAYETLPHYSVLLNIGLSYERSGDYPLAVSYLRDHLTALSEEGKSNPEIEALLRKTLSKVSELEISAECVRESCRIRVDGEDKGSSPVHVIVFPGAHHIQVTSDGSVRITKQLSLGPGENKNFVLSEISEAEESRQDAEDIKEEAEDIEKNDARRAGLGPWFWTSVASLAGIGIVSGVLWGTALRTKRDLDEADELDEQVRLKDKGEALQISAAVTTGLAGAAALTAAVLAGVHIFSSENDSGHGSDKAVSATVMPGQLCITVPF